MMKALHPYVLVLAGTAAQAGEWMRAEGLNPVNIRYVASVGTITGGNMDEPFIVTGTFWSRHDAIQIWEKLMALQTVRTKAPDDIEKYLEHNKRLSKMPNPVPNVPVIIPPLPPEPEPKVFKHIKEPPPPPKKFKKIRER